MQGDPGPSRSLDKKRKNVECPSSSPSSSANTAAVPGKKARKSRSPSATCQTGKIETQWPDYFKEVSVRERNSDLIPRTLHLSCSRYVHGCDWNCRLLIHFPWYIDIQGLLHISMLSPKVQPHPQALNTVLAFCTSRKQFATSFDSLRASIEALLKRLVSSLIQLVHRSHVTSISSPLELEKVAEIKYHLRDYHV